MIGKIIWKKYDFFLALRKTFQDNPRAKSDHKPTDHLQAVKTSLLPCFSGKYVFNQQNGLAVNTDDIVTATDFFLSYHFRELSEEILHFLHSYFICVKSANSGNCNRICKCNVRRRDTKKTCVGVAIFVLSTTFPNFELFGKCSHERTKQRTKKVVSALQQQSS